LVRFLRALPTAKILGANALITGIIGLLLPLGLDMV
jgi:hypothetical protein